MFVLWVFIIHVGCYIYYKLRGQRSNVLQLGLNCLLLTTNNTGCIGWPVLIATVGQQSAVLSMLLGRYIAAARSSIDQSKSSRASCYMDCSPSVSSERVNVIQALCFVFAGVLFFIQLLPVTICCFEYYKWQQTVSA